MVGSKEYSWTINTFYKVSAEDCVNELEKLGEVTPENLVELARDEKNILHDEFEWDDSIAGEKYRIQQARQMIANIRVNYIQSDDETEKKPIQAFVSLVKNQPREKIEVVVNNADKYGLLLNKAYAELNSIKNKYATLTEIQEILKDIPKV